MARLEQLTIYLLKSSFATGTAALRDNVQFETVQLPDGAPPGSSLLVRSTPPHPPAWRRFFPGEVAIDGIIAASAGAVLLVPASDRWFAICFGTGWHLLKKDAFVRSFGLRAALSVVKPDTLKSVDVSTYENFAKHRRVSTSRGTTIDSFDIEGQLDLLRGVIGDCERPAIGKQIGGRDACVVWTRTPFEKVHKLCRVLLTLHESDRVARRYPIVDNIAEVRDPAEIERLDGVLDAQLATNLTLDVTVAPPEVVNWQAVHALTLDHPNAPAPAVGFGFTDIRTMYGHEAPSCLAMRQVQVGTETPAGTAGQQAWTLYDCLVTELDDPNDPSVKCILVAGSWFVVASSYVDQVNQGLTALPNHAGLLPAANATETEGQYNARLAATDPTTLTLLDKENIPYGGGRSRIEVCDVLSSTSCFYHVKDYHGSATLSHLFAQGTVSARLLLEQDFREALIHRYPGLPANVIEVNHFNPAQVEIVYAIICEETRQLPAGLPFFSKVRLIEAARELRRMGFTQVSVAKITRP